MTVALSAEAIPGLLSTLAAGGIAILPTDTVYGLACAARRPAAVARIHALKGRGAPRPAGVMCFTLAAAETLLVVLGPRTRAAAEALLPGPVTLVLPDPGGDWAGAGGDGTVGLRIPALSAALAPLAAVRTPLVQTSANPTGGADPRRVDDLDPALAGAVDVVIDAGELRGRPSTVIDLSGYERTAGWRTLRAGALPDDAVRAAIGPPG